MADASWDNSGLPPQKQGMPTWVKVLLGCGVLCLLFMATCVGGCAYIGHKIKQDPKGFERKIQGMVAEFIKDDWAEAGRIVNQLMTDEGAAALYKANPGLAESYPTEAAFLEAAKGWRPMLEPLPPEMPDMDKHDLSYQNDWNRRTILSFRNGKGKRLRLVWSGPRKDPNRKLVDMSVE